MMFVEILIGTVTGLAIVVGIVFFAFNTPKIKGLSRHNVRGNGSQGDGNHDFDSGDDGGGD